MPELARAVSEPLSKVDKIVIVDGGSGGGASRVTKQVADILAQLPVVIESLSGVDLKKLLKNFPAAEGKKEKPGKGGGQS